MSKRAAQGRVTLDTWREQHADRLDPMRFRFMEALERRAANQDGEVRRLLDARLSALLDAYAHDLRKARKRAKAKPAPVRETLGGLLDHIANHAGNESSSFPELPALDTFRGIWSRLHSQNQLQQALDHLPDNAGPLNSSALIHRSIVLMRELSPGYLQQFLSYVETLSWMEQMNDSSRTAKKRTRTPQR
jgi:hypothetical protein